MAKLNILDCTVKPAELVRSERAHKEALSNLLRRHYSEIKSGKVKSKTIKHQLPDEVRYATDGTMEQVKNRTTTQRVEN